MNDLEAKSLVEKAAPLLTPRESQFVRTIGKIETSYGRGWQDNSHIPGAVGDPKTSFNWGAITTLSEPFFTYMDGWPTKEVRKFKVYSNDGFGIRDLARHLFVKRTMQEPINRGDAKEAIRRMHDVKPIYFELPLELYHKRAKEAYDGIIKRTGEPRLLSFDNVDSLGFMEYASIAGASFMVYKWLKTGRKTK